MSSLHANSLPEIVLDCFRKQKSQRTASSREVTSRRPTSSQHHAGKGRVSSSLPCHLANCFLRPGLAMPGMTEVRESGYVFRLIANPLLQALRTLENFMPRMETGQSFEGEPKIITINWKRGSSLLRPCKLPGGLFRVGYKYSHKYSDYDSNPLVRPGLQVVFNNGPEMRPQRRSEMAQLQACKVPKIWLGLGHSIKLKLG